MIAIAAIDTPTVQWSLISPELVLFGSACFLLLTGALMRPGAVARVFSAVVALLALSGAALASLLLWGDGGAGMSGQLVVDDYGATPLAQQAVDDFRRDRGITEPLKEIDWTGVYWRREC